MFRKFILTVALLPLALLNARVEAADPSAPAAHMVPSDAIVGLEIARPKTLLDLALSPKTLDTITSLPFTRRMTSDGKFGELQAGVHYLEGRLGVKWPDALRRLLGGGVLMTVHPHEGLLVVLDAEDGDLLARLHQAIVEIAEGQAAKEGQANRVRSKDYAGVKVWTFGKDEAHAVLGCRFIWTNRAALLKEVLDLRAKKGEGLASQPVYQGAKKAAGSEAVAVAFANLKVLKQLPAIRNALTRRENPMAVLLFAAMTDALNGADWLGLGATVQQGEIRMKATLDARPASADSKIAFAVPKHAQEGAMPNLAVPGFIAGVSLYRDLHGFYASKDQLFPERTSGLIFFENMMGIFFNGRDLTDEVLIETRPEVRMVVAQQSYDPAVGTPRVQFPAFAAIFHLQHPARAGEMAEEGWQKALGLVNFTRGQKAEPGMIIDRETHSGVRYSVARFSTVDLKEKTDIDVRFNFRPSLARVGDTLVLSSSEGLAKDLIDALQKEVSQGVKALALAHSVIEVDGARLASILEVNRNAIVRKNMVDKGKTQQQAQSEFDFLTGLLHYLSSVKLDIGTVDGKQEATLDVKFDLR